MIGSILIVDDEPLIRRGLTKLIETNDLGWIVAGEAGNGKEALQQLEHLMPDLILTDIRMPVMDGLELTQHISEHTSETAVIILTGYRDFEYAQAALRYGVKEFLLKPCAEEEICRVLRQANEQFRMKSELRQREVREQRVSEDHTLRSALLGLPRPTGERFQEMDWIVGLDFWVVHVETFLPEGKMYRTDDVELLQFAICNITAELMKSQGIRGRWTTVEYGRFAFFLELNDANKDFFEKLFATVHSLLGLPLNVLQLGLINSIWDAVKRFNVHKEGSSVLLVSNNKTVFDDEARIRAIHAEITSLLLLGKHAEVGGVLKASFQGKPEESLAHRKREALCLAMVVQQVMRKDLELEMQTEDIGSELEELRVLLSSSAVEAWVGDRIASLEQATVHWLEERNSGVAERSIRYMEQQYMEECSLATVAAHVHLNPNYFSNLFKKQTGESFSGYLTKLRTDKAKMLLTNTDMKIAEIAEAVGYADSNYFATAFKQSTAHTPSEYRKVHRI
jgi:two-component system response regulator YesN